MRLHSYFNSSTSFRVRIALALKAVPYECVPVDLRAGRQRDPGRRALNPSAGVPVLTDGDLVLSQSLAIIEYLDACYPQPRLLPEDPVARARVMEFSLAVASDIHPVNNLRVLTYLRHVLEVTEAQKRAWYHYWTAEGLLVLERLLQRHGGTPYCFGAAPTLADCCLVPQVFNALRMGCDVDSFPRVMAVHAHCMAQPAFQAAAPANQPDYVAPEPAAR